MSLRAKAILIVIYLTIMYLIFMIGITITTCEIFERNINSFGIVHESACIFYGGLGAVLYCMRGFYINYCALKNMDFNWWPWYILRPFVGSIMGLATFNFISILFVFFNVIMLNKISNFVLFGTAFYVGYKVHKFLGKEGKD